MQIVAATWGSLLLKVDRPKSVHLSWTRLSPPLKEFLLDLTGHVHTTDILTLKRPLSWQERGEKAVFAG